MTYATLYALTCLLAAIWYRRGDPRCECFYEAIFWPVMVAWWLCHCLDDAITWAAGE